MKEKLLLVGMVLLVGMMYATDYAIVVGMNEYRWLNNLRYAEADAEQVGEKLKGLGFNAQILTGRVSDSDIIEEIRYMSMYTNRNDTLLFYFSGHGMPGDSESERGLCTYNTDPDRGSYVVTQQQLKEALENFAGTKIVILDACYQGSEERNLARDNELLDRKLGQQVDLLVTSSAANQGAHDGFWLGNQFIQNGVVGYYLQQALAGEADLNRDGALSADEMSRYLLGYADFMAKENGQNMEVKYKDRNQRLLVLGTGAVQPQRPVVSPPAASSSGSSRVPEGMVLVKTGSFDMGSTGGDSDEKPVHEVELTYDYLIGKYEVTFAEYDLYCESVGKSKPDDEGWGRGSRPVMNVSWWDAIGYCNWLSEKEGLAKAYDGNGNLLDGNGRTTRDITKVEGYRIPTEAEWEYAARGGQKDITNGEEGKDYLYAGSNDMDRVGWYWYNWGEENRKTQPVGEKAPNELGINDMSGNVREWCHDLWDSDWYEEGNQTNPVGPSQAGSFRVIRGGSWFSSARGCRVADRDYFSPGDSSYYLGLRLSRTY